jgi:hypothetical protein
VTRKQLAEIVADLTGKPVMTVANTLIPQLQDDRLMPRGERGQPVDLDAADRINLLLAASLDRAHGVSPGQNLKHWRSLEPAEAVYSSPGSRLSMKDSAIAAFQVVEGLGIKFDDLGTVLDGIVESMRTGAFANWTQGVQVTVTAEFSDDDRASVYFDRPKFRGGAVFTFGSDEAMKREAPIERSVKINREAFERLAQP